MKKSLDLIPSFVLVVLFGLAATAQGGPPWGSLIPLRRVEADPGRDYRLTEDHGPWLILAASFAGTRAEQQAHELVLELRQRYKLPAYVHQQRYDFKERVEGLTLNKYGQRARMRYANASQYDAVAVLVGDFESLGDPRLEKTLEKIKYARPECLDVKKRHWSAQHFVALRELQRRINGDASKRNKGPMGNAFVTRNPLLPEEYFVPSGLDDFVISLNRGVKYSLLDNPGKYTVKVASFGGDETINQSEIAQMRGTGKVTNKLEIAADKAHRLTLALRERGAEAYEFHDRQESVVTVGSFESIGTPRPDGKTEINPAVHRIMQTYEAAKQPIPGQPQLGLQPRMLNGIPFDVQPLPVVVPRRSIALDYAPSRSPLH